MSVDVTPSAPPAQALEGGCTFLENVVVCSPRGATFRTIHRCPTCKQNRRMVCTWYAWYGPHYGCTACGDSWDDGYRNPRPSVRGWRKEAAARIKRQYEAAGTKRRAMQLIDAEMREYR